MIRLLARNRNLVAGAGALILVLALASLRYEGFLTPRILADLLTDNSFRGILAVGMTFVILSGGIDLSVGAVMSLSSVMVGVLVMKHHWPAPAAAAAAVALGTLLGAAQGAVIHAAGIRPFIVTLSGMFFARGLGFLIHLESISIDDPGHAAMAGWGIPLGGGARLPAAALLFLAVALAGIYTARWTSFGRDVYAVGGNEESARLMGRPVGRVKVAVYALSGFCAALGGLALSFYLSSGNHLEGVGMELDAVAAVVVGGTLLSGGVGSVAGTVTGVLLVGVIFNVAITRENLSSGLTRVLIGGLLLGAVLLQRLLGSGPRRD